MSFEGVLLCGGASSRMGRPKALLRLPSGVTLLEQQLALLQTAGARNVIAVAGAHYEQIKSEALASIVESAVLGGPLREDPARTRAPTASTESATIPTLPIQEIKRSHRSLVVIHNARWASGRFSSVHAGLSALARLATADTAGVILLPVDCPGIAPATILETVGKGIFSGRPVRPFYQGSPGHLLFLPPSTIKDLLKHDLSHDVSLRGLLEESTLAMECADPAILHNLNTPVEWESYCSTFR